MNKNYLSDFDKKFLLQLAIESVITAGKEILNVYNKSFRINYKADKSPLTEADLISNKIIHSFLRNETLLKNIHLLFPILSEESKTIDYKVRKDWIFYWLVDPLDGTKEFIKQNGEFTINIALIKKDIPLLGVVYAPYIDILYFGLSGYGSYKIEKATSNVKLFIKELIESNDNISINNEFEELIIKNILTDINRIEIMNKSYSNSNMIKIIASRSHLNDKTKKFISFIEKIFKKVEIVSKGSSLKLCLIAEGKADIYPRFAPTMEWDTAAAHAVVKFSGNNVLKVDDEFLQRHCNNNGFEVLRNYLKNLNELKYNKRNLLNPYFLAINKNLIY